MNIHKMTSQGHESARKLVTVSKPRSAASEAYRALRTNLGFAGIEQTYRTILITSPNAQDGKSSIAANLAVVMAQAGHEILLADCDLRKPSQHKIFELSNQLGFTTCISQNISIEKIALRLMVDHLSILTSGPIPPNPAEILSSARTQALWPNLLEKYEYIIIDAPPMLAVTDSAILSTQVDGTILVVRPGKTRIEEARQAGEQLTRANAKLIGVVLNKVKMDIGDYYKHY